MDLCATDDGEPSPGCGMLATLRRFEGVPLGFGAPDTGMMSLENKFEQSYPKGPSTQSLRTLVPRTIKWHGFWNQKPQILGTWTLRDRLLTALQVIG